MDEKAQASALKGWQLAGFSTEYYLMLAHQERRSKRVVEVRSTHQKPGVLWKLWEKIVGGNQ